MQRNPISRPPRALAFVTAFVGVAGALALLWLRSPPAPPAAPMPGAPATALAVGAPPAQEIRSARDPEPVAPAPSTLGPERLQLMRADPTLRERARQQQLAPAADARWHEAVDAGGYTAHDLDPAVRALFRRIGLEPRYAEGGRIDGLVIRDLPPDHPLARIGFRVGDRIDRIQGTALEDPAEIPSLLSRLGPNVGFCADREGVEICREVALE